MLTRRIAAVAAGVALGAVAFAGNAFAHVEVSAKPAQALAKNAVVSFSAEAESSAAGIASVEVVLPQGIPPADVTYVSGPSGWALTATATGYSITGKALGVHKDAQYSIKIAQLPNARSIAFKTLVKYANGDVDRWIEIPSASNPDPQNPAPVLKLAAAPSPTTAPATEVSPAPSAAETQPAVTATSGTATAPAASTSPVIWVIFVILVLVAGALAITLVRRKMGKRA